MMDVLVTLLVWVLLPDRPCDYGFALVDSASEFFERGAKRGRVDLPARLHAERLPLWLQDKLRTASRSLRTLSRTTWLVRRLLTLTWRACRLFVAWCAWLLDNPPPLLVLSVGGAWGDAWLLWLLVPEGTWAKIYSAVEAEVKAASSLRVRKRRTRRPLGTASRKRPPAVESDGAAQPCSHANACDNGPTTKPSPAAKDGQSTTRLSPPGTPKRVHSRGAASASPGSPPAPRTPASTSSPTSCPQSAASAIPTACQPNPHKDPCEAAASPPSPAASTPASTVVAPATPSMAVATQAPAAQVAQRQVASAALAAAATLHPHALDERAGALGSKRVLAPAVESAQACSRADACDDQPATKPAPEADGGQSSPRLSCPGTPERVEPSRAASVSSGSPPTTTFSPAAASPTSGPQFASSAAASPGQSSPHGEPCEAAAAAPALAAGNPGSAAVGVAPAAPASEAAAAEEAWRAKLAPYTDKALAMLSQMLPCVVKLTAASRNADQAMRDVRPWQRLGQGAFGTVLQLLVPWPEEVLPLVQSAFPALTAGLPLVAKVILDKPGADSTQSRAWREQEARQCEAANACGGFARLLRAHHGPHDSVLLYECATVAPRNLTQYVADLRAAGATHMPAEQVCSLVCQVASALGSLHAPHGGGGGVVHNDVKPDNLIVHGEGACVQVVDLGLALPVGSTVGEHGVCGTDTYMPPELAAHRMRGVPAKRAAAQYLPCNDWYSLGGVAVFLMTLGGDKRFDDVAVEYDDVVIPTMQATFYPEEAAAHMDDARFALCRLPGATEGLVQLVLALMGPREQRPQDYAALLPLLEAAAANSRPAVYNFNTCVGPEAAKEEA